MFAASKTDSVSAVAPDDKFNYVTMLLHGDGTNGAQNNTFLDSSTNNFTITRNGNTTQGSFSPYGSNWSNYFDGSSYLTIADNSAFALGTNNFTIEGWVYATGTTGGLEFIIGQNSGSASTSSFDIRLSNGQIQAKLYYDVSTVSINTSSNLRNAWNHFAFVRNGSDLILYVNGTSVGTNTIGSNSVTNSATDMQIGTVLSGSYIYTGYLSNLRIVNGTAVYTSAFTPPTTPLTAITNTALLTCQSNRFIDNSTNNFSSTITGSPSVQRFNPFGTATAYSTSVIGGSGYFDGNGDYLNAPNNTAFQIGTGDFTYECWLYPTNLGGSQKIGFVTGSGGGFGFGLWTNTIQYGHTDIANVFSFTASGMINNQWIHFAVSRASGTMHSYVNGVRIDSRSNSTNFSSYDKASIGAYYDGGNGFTGYISDAKFTKGTGVYTGTTLTVPTAPVSAGSCTLLCSMTNGAIFDNAMMNNLETVGNAQISTSVKKYGTGSLAFDGSGDYLTTPNSPNLNFGSGDFTIELWLYSTVGTSNESVVNKGYNNAGNLSYLLFLDSNTLGFFASSNGTSFDIANNVSMGTATQNTWVHFAASRSGSSIRLFRNGTLINTVTSSATIYTGTTNLYIGSSDSGGLNFNGYIDDLRITKGFARYTANFTAPTSALSDTGPY